MKFYTAPYRAPDDAPGGDAIDTSQYDLTDDSDLTLEPPEDDAEADVTDPPVTVPAPLTAASLSDQDLRAEVEKRQATWAPQQQPQAPPEAVADPRLARVAELQAQAVSESYTDPDKAEQTRSQAYGLQLEIQTDAIKKELTGQMAAEIAQLRGHITPIATERTITGITANAHEQEYFRAQAVELQKDGIDMNALLKNANMREVYTKAAKQYAAEKAPANIPKHISASSEAISVDDLREAREFERMTGTKIDKETVQMAKAMSSRNPFGGMN